MELNRSTPNGMIYGGLETCLNSNYTIMLIKIVCYNSKQQILLFIFYMIAIIFNLYTERT